ncbi:ArnT family glycosyltransferase [Abditibacterium utsteinense]|uniref:ArnT family glycosyltransferase n=1 Tax=Abditibacterium utsteinense TaxID=1960156 RepID=UPI001EE6CB7F|nr:glycosyltransferase family 39 protein [Abditibacterium utsteinense]
MIFGLALTVRFIGSSWGLPNAARWYSYHPDESTRQIVGAVVSLLQGDFNPHFFNYPSLSIYATWGVYQLLAGLGLTTNATAPQYPWPVVRDVIFAGRLFSIFCGAATAPLIFLIARRLNLGKAAVLAGVLIALAPGHVQHSHFATVDVPASFFVTLCFYLTLRAENWRGLAWAALVAGLAAGTKYNAGIVVIAPLFALHFLWNRDTKHKVLASLALVFLTLASAIVTTPYALLAPREFWGDGLRGGESGFAYELLVHPKIGSGEIFQGTGNGWIYHFTFNLPFVLTWPIVIVALIGIYFAAKKRELWPILAFVSVFFFSLGFSQVRFMRYLLPLAPLLCLLAAFGASRLPKPRICGLILGLFALWGTKDVLWPFVQTDPRDSSIQSQGSHLTTFALAHNPWFYTPPFQPQGFNNPVAGMPVTGFNREKIEAVGDIFAVSEFEWRETVRLQPDGDVAQLLKQLGRFEIAKTRIPFALPGRDFVPHDYLYTNPETRLYFVGK